MPHEDLIIDGEKWPSVTEVISVLQKPGLNNWLEAVGPELAQEISSKAAKRGNEAHKAIEEYLTKNNPESHATNEGFRVWYNDFWNIGPYTCDQVELKVKHSKLKYHGTLDAVLNDETYKYITDWKFSNSDDALRAFQLAGYALAYEDQYKVEMNRGIIVRIEFKKNRQGEITPRLVKPLVYTNLEPYKVMFKSLVKWYNKNAN